MFSSLLSLTLLPGEVRREETALSAFRCPSAAPRTAPLPTVLPASGAIPVGTRAGGCPAHCGALLLVLSARMALQGLAGCWRHPRSPGLGKAVAGSLLAKGWAEQSRVALVRVFLWGWGPGGVCCKCLQRRWTIMATVSVCSTGVASQLGDRQIVTYPAG